MGRLDGKVAVVTGGGNGIGRACCVRFAEEGADVVVADLDEDAAGATGEVVTATGRRALAFRLDASSPEDNDALVARAVEALGGIDVLVTAAGISHRGYRSGHLDEELALLAGPVLDPARQFAATRLEDWQAVLDVNLTGTFLAVRAAATRMLDQRRGGSIVTIASIAAKYPEAAPSPYSVSKAGVWMLTKVAARQLAKAGIRVNAIGPGFIETNMTAIITQMGAQDLVLQGVPMGRMGTPAEVAAAALFLASDESSYFTGEILHPDGGFYTD